MRAQLGRYEEAPPAKGHVSPKAKRRVGPHRPREQLEREYLGHLCKERPIRLLRLVAGERFVAEIGRALATDGSATRGDSDEQSDAALH